MIRGQSCFISILRSMIRSRTLIWILCVLFLMLSIKVAPNSCNASEMERGHENHFHIVSGVTWNHSSMPGIPIENCCSYTSSVSSCCMDAINNKLVNSHVSLPCRDTLRQLSALQITVIEPSACTPLGQKERFFPDLNSFLQKDFFLDNCTFLI